ncbi:translation initiation factor 5A [Sarcoptes scabiei]|nr:translation initiation factor 5A [Sarcoptes scabiei]
MNRCDPIMQFIDLESLSRRAETLTQILYENIVLSDSKIIIPESEEKRSKTGKRKTKNKTIQFYCYSLAHFEKLNVE